MSLVGLKEYHLPGGLPEAIDLLDEHGESALVVAGGTFVHGLSARGLLFDLDVVVDLSRTGLDHIEAGDGRLAIGATATFADILASPAVSGVPALGAISDALACPPAQIMNVATIGGCVAASCPLFDMPVSLLALEASVKSMSRSGEKQYEIGGFLAGLFENAMDTGEIVTEVGISGLTPEVFSAFVKLETNANDLAILNAAARLTIRDAICVDARIFVGGGVGEVPVRAAGAEAGLRGKQLTDENVGAAAAAAKGDVQPVSDQRASAAYRTAMTEVLVRKAIRGALLRSGQG